jgi:hypothetical protein
VSGFNTPLVFDSTVRCAPACRKPSLSLTLLRLLVSPVAVGSARSPCYCRDCSSHLSLLGALAPLVTSETARLAWWALALRPLHSNRSVLCPCLLGDTSFRGFMMRRLVSIAVVRLLSTPGFASVSETSCGGGWSATPGVHWTHHHIAIFAQQEHIINVASKDDRLASPWDRPVAHAGS